jgi:mono/diheme cytochrome c family protein
VKAAPVVAAALAGVAAFAGVTLSSGDEPRDGAAVTSPLAAGPRAVAEGRGVFARFGCGTCHTLSAARARGGIGPNLDRALPGYDRDSLTAKILAPYADGPPTGFAVMPSDFGDRMTDRELDALVSFLLDPG